MLLCSQREISEGGKGLQAPKVSSSLTFPLFLSLVALCEDMHHRPVPIKSQKGNSLSWVSAYTGNMQTDGKEISGPLLIIDKPQGALEVLSKLTPRWQKFNTADLYFLSTPNE